jgi:hypothetical protein
MRNNQQKQCNALSVLEKMIRKKVLSLGLDYRKVSIGGYDGGLFEKMFKIQPSKYMSKAQFLTAMRSVFGFDLSPKTEQQLNALFQTFDLEDRNELDWRAFLYQLAVIIHAYEPVLTHLKMGYAIFSSLGYLEFHCTEKLQLSTIKDIIEVPVIFSSRSAVRSFIDDCWFELIQSDLEAMEVCLPLSPSPLPPLLRDAHLEQIAHAKNAPSDSDELWLTFSVFNKLIQNTAFATNLEGAKVFGKRGVPLPPSLPPSLPPHPPHPPSHLLRHCRSKNPTLCAGR